jgi:hypothetical protein
LYGNRVNQELTESALSFVCQKEKLDDCHEHNREDSTGSQDPDVRFRPCPVLEWVKPSLPYRALLYFVWKDQSRESRKEE